jgi:small nuclear ribonucleoprotein (snRNP)-like protein
MMDPMEFNFIDKRVVIDLVTGNNVDGTLYGADQEAFYIKEDVGGYFHKRIVYKKHVTAILCVEKKPQSAVDGGLTPPPGMGVRIF